ncbi:MAG: caspase family protein [Cyanobacteria bacterium P01_A01_bin.116]
MTKVALLIGVSEYEPGLNPLPAAVKDVAALKNVLADSDIGEFDEVKVLTNPDRQVMQYEIETLFQGRHKDDLVLLFFSGHGIKDDSNNLYFATRITRKNPRGNLLRSTAVPARFIHEAMNDSRAKRQAIILDCCFSGAFDPALQAKNDDSVDLKSQLGAEGRVVLTSSSSTQYSFEEQGSELSLYTRYLVEGIETGAGDRDEDGKISLRELHDYATDKVRETAPNMTPKLITLKDMGLDIVLAKAKITNPELKYRRQVEECAQRGSISPSSTSPVGRIILDRLRHNLGLEPKVAKVIETEVLKPYQEHLENLQHYRQAFSVAIEQEFPLSAHSQAELESLQKVLGLRQKDVAAIERQLSEQNVQKQKAEQLKHQENLRRYQQEFQKAIDAEYPLRDYVRDGLRKFQQSLGLQTKEVESIERPVVTKKEADFQNAQRQKDFTATSGPQQYEADTLENYSEERQTPEKKYEQSESKREEIRDTNEPSEIGYRKNIRFKPRTYVRVSGFLVLASFLLLPMALAAIPGLYFSVRIEKNCQLKNYKKAYLYSRTVEVIWGILLLLIVILLAAVVFTSFVNT